MPEIDTSESYSTADAVFGLLERELWLVTSGDGTRRGGLISTFVSKASIVPELPRLMIGLAKQHNTCTLVRDSGRFTAHLLWLDQIELVWRFGLRSGRERDKFTGMQPATSPLGNPLIGDALAWLDCSVEATLDLGDRMIFVAAVRHAQRNGDGQPLTVNRVYFEAPDDKRERLERMYEHDSQVDAAAIHAWRRSL
jgi:flavin reductase (DIM6/NTAB) family NADH-FMN oxidoreductase RutF